jgi:hypothetical protein
MAVEYVAEHAADEQRATPEGNAEQNVVDE